MDYFDSNEYLAELANDYDQAQREMGPDDFVSWETYAKDRADAARKRDEQIRNVISKF